MNKALACYLIGMNLLGLILMGTDKSLARRHKWRIAERTLFLTAALGGAFGSWLGMYLFRQDQTLVFRRVHAAAQRGVGCCDLADLFQLLSL